MLHGERPVADVFHFVNAMGLGERTRGAMQGVESANSSPAETEMLCFALEVCYNSLKKGHEQTGKSHVT